MQGWQDPYGQDEKEQQQGRQIDARKDIGIHDVKGGYFDDVRAVHGFGKFERGSGAVDTSADRVDDESG